MRMNSLTILQEARKKIVAGWTIGRRGENARGYWANPESPEAVKWCALGALDAVMQPAMGINCDGHAVVRALDKSIPKEARAQLLKEWDGRAECRVAQYNNGTDKQTILRLFDVTIKRLKKARESRKARA